VRTSAEGSFKASQSSRQVSRWTQDRRASTTQGKNSIENTTRTVIDTVDEADDKQLTSLNQWNGCKKRHTLLATYRRKTTVLQPSIENTQPDCIWLQGEKLHSRFSRCAEELPKQGEHKVKGQDTYLFALDDFIQSKATGSTRTCMRHVTRDWHSKEICLNHTPLFRIETLHQVCGRSTDDRRFTSFKEDTGPCSANNKDTGLPSHSATWRRYWTKKCKLQRQTTS